MLVLPPITCIGTNTAACSTRLAYADLVYSLLTPKIMYSACLPATCCVNVGPGLLTQPLLCMNDTAGSQEVPQLSLLCKSWPGTVNSVPVGMNDTAGSLEE